MTGQLTVSSLHSCSSSCWGATLLCVCVPWLQALEKTPKPSLSEPDISPRQVDWGCEGGVTLPLAHPPLPPESIPSTGQTSAGALRGHSPLWYDDMGDDILKLLIARANFYDKAIRLVHVGVELVVGVGLAVRGGDLL